jgi:hypothetical protein
MLAILLALLTTLVLKTEAASKAGDVIPNQYIVQLPVVNTAAAILSSFEQASLDSVTAFYANQLGPRGIKVLSAFRAVGKDTLLVNASSTALKNLTALGAKIYQNRVMKAAAFAPDAPWGLTVSHFSPGRLLTL